MELLLGFVCVLMSWVGSVAYSVGLALLVCFMFVLLVYCVEKNDAIVWSKIGCHVSQVDRQFYLVVRIIKEKKTG